MELFSSLATPLLLLAFVTLPLDLQGAEGSPFVLVEKGCPTATIHVSKSELDDAPDLRLAIEELNYHLRVMSGAGLEVKAVRSPGEVTPPAVILGKLARVCGIEPPRPENRFADGGFHLKATKDRLLISGASAAGTLNGVYELLERLGCAWVMPGPEGEMIPKRDAVTIDPLDLEQQPGFAIATLGFSESGRKTFPKEAKKQLETWKRRMRLDSDEAVEAKKDPLLSLVGAHAAHFITRKYAEEFKADPELRPRIRMPDGTWGRGDQQLEPSSSGTVDIVIRYIRDTFKENRWPKDKKVAISVGPAEVGGGGFSDSPATLAINEGRVDPMSGVTDRTNEPIYLANRLFEKIGGEFPNLHLGQLLCGSHSGPPSENVPADPRFVLGAVDVAFSRYHSTVDERSPSRSLYRHILERWHEVSLKQGNPLYYGGFTWNLAEAILPYTKVRIWGEDIPFYHQRGFLLPTMKGTPAWAVLGPSDYIYARMAWDPKRSWKKELRQYAVAAFGEEAGAIMEGIYLKQIGRQHSARQEAGSFFAYPLIYDEAFTQDILNEFGKAEGAASTASRKALVRQQRHPWEQLARYLAMRQAAQRFDYATAVRLHHEMIAAHDAMKKDNVLSVSRSARGFLESRFKPELETGLQYSSGQYQLVCPVPERLPVRFDPHNAGETMGLFSADYNLDQLVKIATSSSTWDAQGLPWAMSGTVWYYFEFDGSLIPPGSEGVGLFLGRVEDQSSVWVNDKPFGTIAGFSRPHVHDITGGVDRKGKNRVAVAVRKLRRNEIGIGGLVSPAFVFAGPRLRGREPNEEKELLPDGVKE